MANVFLRALQRANVPVAYSEGFHPKPRLAFEDALPVGMESLDEAFTLVVRNGFSPQELVRGLNAELPEGLTVEACEIPIGERLLGLRQSVYRVQGSAGFWDPVRMARFAAAEHFILESTDKKGRPRHTDLKRLLVECRPLGPDTLEMIILEDDGGRKIRPADILRSVMAMDVESLRRVRVIKLRVAPRQSESAGPAERNVTI
jgi:radical SAM-linked protein